jgi:hypothetical protein
LPERVANIFGNIHRRLYEDAKEQQAIPLEINI